MPPQRFSIEIPQVVLDDLQTRVSRTRWTDLVFEDDWQSGARPGFMRQLVAYWQAEFDWRAQERMLNSLPHYQVMIDGIRLHFIHVPGRGPRPLPLLLTNGWPSTFFEYTKLIPLLADPGAHGGERSDAFDLVVPSLPGFGFSDRQPVPGTTRRIPELWGRLMCEVLGYDRFGAHGSDIGAFVTNRLGLEHADRVLGIHVTVPAEPYIGSGAPDLGPRERLFLERRARAVEPGGGYAHMQRTRPQTLAYGLADSPVGLAAWLIDKWQAWSDCGGDVERRFSKDELLTTVMLYWVTGTIASSFRPYVDWSLGVAPPPFVDELHPGAPRGVSAPLARGEHIAAPAAVALFVRDNPPPKEWGERAYGDLRRWTAMPRGGHFAAFEEPALLAEDLREFFRPLRRAPIAGVS